MTPSDRPRDRLPAPVRRHPAMAAVLVVTVVALAMRLYAVGERVAHWDEGRVGHWAVRYAESGTYEYRPITHGPFIEIVNGPVFEALGATDTTARLVVVVVGGLLPLVALLFRSQLSDVEVVALAAVLAVDPVMLYYSRFMRNDLLLGAFALVAFALFVRAYTHRQPAALYLGAFALALGFTTKENAVVYVLCWFGAVGLVLGEALVRRRLQGPASRFDHVAAVTDRWRERLRDDPGDALSGALRWGGHATGAALVSLAVLTFFYAPRGDAAAVELGAVLGRPGALSTVVDDALFEYFPQGYEYWFEGKEEGLTEDLAEPAGNMYRTLAFGSGVALALSVVGFVHERVRAERPRALVLAAAYWGYVSILGYPLVASVERPAWLVVHVVVPLSIPAAVGAGVLYRMAVASYRDRDTVSVALAALILLAAATGTLGVGYDTSYANPQAEDNVMVQYAQPSGDLRGSLDAMATSSERHDGVDVLFYGEKYYLEDESVADRAPAGDGEWYDRLPLPWYTSAYDSTVASAETTDGLEAALEEDPPIIIAEASEADAVDERVEGYDSGTYDLRGPGGEQLVVVYVDERYADG